MYFTDFVVRADRRFQTLDDTFGGAFAFSTEHSHSGDNAVLDAVIAGDADVTGRQLCARPAAPARERAVPKVRVIATTVATPSAPLVASPTLDVASRDRLTETLLSVHTAPDMAGTLDELLLARFVRVRPSDLEVFLDRQHAAEAAGYPKLA